MTRSAFYSLLVAAIAALTACQADRTYDEDAQHYRDALGITDAAPVVADDAPLTLQQTLALTNRHNENLAIEGENYVQALVERQRRVAAFLPTVTFGPAYGRRAGDGGNIGGGSGRNQFDAPVAGEINLFNGYSDVASLYANAATIEERRAIVQNLQATFLFQTAFNFYNALRLERSVEALAYTITLQEERLRDIRKRQETGLARPLDVSQADAQAADTRVQHIAALNAHRNALSALRLLTAHPMATRKLVDDYAPPDSTEAVDHWQNIAASKRHDVLASDQRLVAARHDVEAAFGQYYPSVTFNLEYVLTIDNASTENQWNAVLRASLPIFSAGLIEADVRTAWSRVRQAYLASIFTRRQVVFDVEIAHQEFESAGAQIVQLHRRVTAAELALKQAEANYDVQLATNLDRLTAQDELLSARLDLITQQYLRKVAYLRLLQASGLLQAEMNVGLPRDRELDKSKAPSRQGGAGPNQ